MSEVSEKVYKGSRYGTFMTVSKVTLMTSASDDGAVIKCRATHPALVPGAVYPHLQDSANLTIYCKFPFYYTNFIICINFIALFLLLRAEELEIIFGKSKRILKDYGIKWYLCKTK